MSHAALLAVAGLTLFGAPSARAQSATDSLARLRALTEAVRADRSNHAAWYERGMLAWAIARQQRRVTAIRNDSGPSLFDVADSSLQRALKLRDDDARYVLALGRYRWSSTNGLTR
ncbi:MAG TPA: hypothetical protein VFB46_01750, partial [Gemmatimonadaceae bacterium]|nr:hypothetical protein [Gemmatimonadaceae bacterium]